MAQRGHGIDGDGFDVAGLEPLAGEVADERFGARIGEHPLELGVEILAKLAAIGQVEQFLVRHRGPEEIREPRGEGMLVDERMRLALRYGGRRLPRGTRNRGDASTATIAWPMPSSKPLPG